MMKNSDIKAMSDEQLVHSELQLQRDIVHTRIDQVFEKSEDMMKLRKVRRNIARLRTEQRAREIKADLAKDNLRNTHRKTFVPAQSETTDSVKSLAEISSQIEE